MNAIMKNKVVCRRIGLEKIENSFQHNILLGLLNIKIKIINLIESAPKR